MNLNPKVSIILPVYNGESTIKRTVMSLLAQTYEDFEIIACIDGTNDGSEVVLRSFKDERIKVIKNKYNLGLGRTMNVLISHCQPESEYVAIAEQDDWYYPYRIEEQVNILENDAEVGMVSGIAEHYDGDKVTFSFPQILVEGGQYPRDFKEMFLLNFREQIKVVNTCMMIRKSVHINNGFYFSQHYPNIPVDWQYVMRFSLVAIIHGIKKPLVLFDKRKERESVTTKKRIMHLAGRELLRNVYWEFNQIIPKRDFKYALNTQILLESRQLSIWKYFLRMLEAIFNYPGDIRIFKNLSNLGHRVKLRVK